MENESRLDGAYDRLQPDGWGVVCVAGMFASPELTLMV
jgi:hypothetical protein